MEPWMQLPWSSPNACACCRSERSLKDELIRSSDQQELLPICKLLVKLKIMKTFTIFVAVVTASCASFVAAVPTYKRDIFCTADHFFQSYSNAPGQSYCSSKVFPFTKKVNLF
jgi:hypothetical protein